MRIKEDEVRAGVEQFVRSALRHESDPILGVKDLEDLASQVKDGITTALATDPNAIYHLMKVGLRGVAGDIQKYLNIIAAIEDLLPSLTAPTRQELITTAMLNRVDSALLQASINPADYPTVQRLTGALDDLSVEVAVGLVSKGKVMLPLVEAQDSLVRKVVSLQEEHDLLVTSLDSLLAGEQDYVNASDPALRSQRTVGAVKSLLTEFRVDWVDGLLPHRRRQRLIELQAAKAALQITMNTTDPSTPRLKTGEIPATTDIRMHHVGEAEDTIQVTSTKSGGYTLEDGDTVAVKVDGTPVTVTFPKVVTPTLLGKAPPSYSSPQRYLYFLVELEDLPSGPYEAKRRTTTSLVPNGEMRVVGGHAAMVGHFCVLRYDGPALTTSVAEDAVNAIEAVSYRIVNYKASLTEESVVLDPPLPSVTTDVPIEGWSLYLIPLIVRWAVSAADPNYLDQLVLEMSGPRDNNSPDVYQPWRVHTKLEPNVAAGGSASGHFIAGERIYNKNGALGEREGVVVSYDQARGRLYIAEAAHPFQTGDTIEGRDSGAQIDNIWIPTYPHADRPDNSGQQNSARYITASAHGGRLRVQARTQLGAGTDCSIGVFGDLSIVLGTGERGLQEIGVYPGMTIQVDGQDYTIDLVLTNSTASVRTPVSAVNNKAWSVPMPKTITKLTLLPQGYKTISKVLDVSSTPGYVAGDFFRRTVYDQVMEGLPANSLEMQIPQSDSLGPLTDLEVVSALKEAGLEAESLRTTLYTHPDSEAPLTLTVDSNEVTVPGALPSDPTNLAGHYLIPEEGDHRGREYLIVSDSGATRTLRLDGVGEVTESLSSYRIEARRFVIKSPTKTTESALELLPTGTAHTKLGLPASGSYQGEFKSVQFRETNRTIGLNDLNVIVGDKIHSLAGLHDPLTISAIDGLTVTVEEGHAPLSGAPVLIPGSCPDSWDSFRSNLGRAVGSLTALGQHSLDRLERKLTPITAQGIRPQESDVGEFSRELYTLKTAMQDILSVLNGYSSPDVRSARRVLESLDEQGLDRAKDLILSGKFKEFFELESSSATRAGRVEEVLSNLGKSFGEERDLYGETGDEEVRGVVLGSEEPDEEDGARGDILFGDEGDGETDSGRNL